MSKKLAEHTDTELLAEVLRRHPPQQGPGRVSWSSNPLVVTLPIGRDHTASLFLHEDDIKAMEKINDEASGKSLHNNDNAGRERVSLTETLSGLGEGSEPNGGSAEQTGDAERKPEGQNDEVAVGGPPTS